MMASPRPLTAFPRTTVASMTVTIQNEAPKGRLWAWKGPEAKGGRLSRPKGWGYGPRRRPEGPVASVRCAWVPLLWQLPGSHAHLC
jgi:hypothetical protein